jgi:signal transduction histidine kinase
MSLARDTFRRIRSIRTSLLLLALVPSTALALVWIAADSVQLSRALDLRGQTSLGYDIAGPGNDLRYNFQLERRLTAAWLAEAGSSRTALSAQRVRTDASLASAGKSAADFGAAPASVKAALAPISDALEGFRIRDLRERIDQREISQSEAAAGYTSVIVAQLTSLANVTAQVSDGPLVVRSMPLGSLVTASEQIQLEDMTLSAALADGQLTPAVRAQFTMAVGIQRWQLNAGQAQASPVQRAALRRITESVAWQRMNDVENAILAGEPGDGLPDSAKQWRSALDGVGEDLAALIQDETRQLIDLQTSTADDQVQWGMLLSVSGLFAVLASILLAWRVTRSLLRRLVRLREATVMLAEKQLPDIVARLDAGERVDVGTQVKDLDVDDDELGAVTRAFNSAQRTAVTTAVALNDTRRGFEKAILGIARHSQNLVNRQVELLDKLEREHYESDVLEGLYQLDSQANQLRRYEENLIVMSGGRPGRQWREPVVLMDVLRSAAGEVAEYQRITVEGDDHTRLAAHAVADVIHLFAELMENATQLSPQVCPVVAKTELVGLGLAIQIEDRGLGMSERDLAHFNHLLRKPPRFETLALGDDSRLGLFVVSRLADRHNIKVTLRRSAYGGTVAIVLIPETVLVRAPQQQGFLNEGFPGAGRGELMTHGPHDPTRAQPAYDEAAYSRSAYGRPAQDRLAAPARAAQDWIGNEFPHPAEIPPSPLASPPPAPGWTSTPPLGSGWSSFPSSEYDWSVTRQPVTGWLDSPLQSDVGPPPPLPQRVPDANLAEELRTEQAPEQSHAVISSGRQAAAGMSAFLHGTRRARDTYSGNGQFTAPSSASASSAQQTSTKDT